MLQASATHEIIIINSRHKNALIIPRVKKKVGTSTFSHFFASFVNNMMVEDVKLDFNIFKQVILNNVNLLFSKFVSLFPKFDLYNKNFDYLIKKKDEIV
jgi:hypothetical protein